MSAIVKFIKETYNKQTLGQAIKAGGWKALIDGNVAETTIIHSPGAELIGSDRVGNKYYERRSDQFGRHRWVVYGNLNWPEGQDPTTVDPSWHAWLHFVNDAPPTQVPVYQPLYAIGPARNMTGTPMTYLPKGSWENPQKRNWKKYTRWDPAAAK